jgi:hypothetical protein
MVRTWLVFACAALIAACAFPKQDPRTASVANTVFEEFHRADNATIAAQLTAEYKTPDILSKLGGVEQFIPAPEPKRRTTIGWNTVVVSGVGSTDSLTQVFDYGDRTALVTTTVFWPADKGSWQLKGFHFQIATAKELATNDFSLSGKSPGEYGFLALVILSPILMILALIKVIRAKGLKRKWLWGILAFAGLFSFHMNWATGGMAISWLTIQLLGAGVTTGIVGFEPWILTMTAPIGALLILTGVWANPARAKKPSKSATQQPLNLSGEPGDGPT